MARKKCKHCKGEGCGKCGNLGFREIAERRGLRMVDSDWATLSVTLKMAGIKNKSKYMRDRIMSGLPKLFGKDKDLIVPTKDAVLKCPFIYIDYHKNNQLSCTLTFVEKGESKQCPFSTLEDQNIKQCELYKRGNSVTVTLNNEEEYDN